MRALDVVVVGAGAMGSACAWHAARLGAGRVLLLDRGAPASGTSARAVGVVNRLLWNPLDIALVDRSLLHLRSLEAASDGAFHFHATGSLMLVDETRRPAARRSLATWRAQGLEVAELAPDEVADLPGCDALRMVAGERALFLDGDGWCVTTDAVGAMLREARALGVEVRSGARVAEVRTGEVRLQDEASVRADAIIVAAGVWTPQVFGAHWRVPLAAYRPQAAVFAVAHDEAMPAVHDLPNHTYWRSEGSAKVLVGDGTVLARQDTSLEPPVEPGFAAAVREQLARRWPAATLAPLVRAWAGYEAGTPDRRPLLGEVPGLARVSVCAGGNGFGFMRSAALGEAAASLALGRAPPVPVKEYDPARFSAGFDPEFPLREGFSLG